MFESGLWIILLEVCAAIAMAAFIVWWTWPRAPRIQARADDTGKPAVDKAGGAGADNQDSGAGQ